jgi:predicted DNA-binding ribbon-helix-helix protein
VRGRPKGSRTRNPPLRQKRPSHLEQRNLDLRGKRTTTTLEPEFWGVLERAAAVRCIALDNIVREVDTVRGKQGLAPALRVYALRWMIAEEARRDDA